MNPKRKGLLIRILGRQFKKIVDASDCKLKLGSIQDNRYVWRALKLDATLPDIPTVVLQCELQTPATKEVSVSADQGALRADDDYNQGVMMDDDSNQDVIRADDDDASSQGSSRSSQKRKKNSGTGTVNSAKKKKKHEKKKVKVTPSEPKWSPLLRKEIAENRMHLTCNTHRAVEEISWHIIDKVETWHPAQGTYKVYANFLIKQPGLDFLRDKGADDPAARLASSISSFIRKQRVELKKRRTEQEEEEGLARNIPIQDSSVQEMKELMNSSINQARAVALIKKTYNYRRSLEYDNYEEVLKAEPFLGSSKYFQIEMALCLDPIATEDTRKKQYSKMIETLKVVDGVTKDEVLSVQQEVELLQIVYKSVTPKNFFQNKQIPIELKEKHVGTTITHSTGNSMAFSIEIFHFGDKVQDVYLLGNKKVILHQEINEVREAIEVLIGAYK
ncbi:Glycerol-3-phosphate dehydrogenase [NAD(P)+], partial [Frankliniella fusca]